MSDEMDARPLGHLRGKAILRGGPGDGKIIEASRLPDCFEMVFPTDLAVRLRDDEHLTLRLAAASPWLLLRFEEYRRVGGTSIYDWHRPANANGLRPWRRRRAQQATKHRRFRECLLCQRWFSAHVVARNGLWSCERNVCRDCFRNQGALRQE